MFTGIIEQVGKVKNIKNKGNQAIMTFLFENNIPDMTLGESIAVNGVCLTVSDFSTNYFSADVSDETMKRSTLGKLKLNEMVNLEQALKFGNRLGGHLVSGHVDGTGHISKKIRHGEHILLTIDAPEKIMRYIIEKGSVAVDGISLTVASCDDKSFAISLVPLTETGTNLRWKKSGDVVNLENDMIGKYIEKFVNLKNRDNGKKSGLNEEFLRKHGFN